MYIDLLDQNSHPEFLFNVSKDDKDTSIIVISPYSTLETLIEIVPHPPRGMPFTDTNRNKNSFTGFINWDNLKKDTTLNGASL